MAQKPSNEEYPEYYGPYIALVPDESIEDSLINQLAETTALLLDLEEAQANYRYAVGKWTLKEVIGHIIDTERIMSYRFLRIARGDRTPLAGFDENQYVEGASFQSRLVTDLVEELIAVRQSTLTLMRGLTEESWSRKGIANDTAISARAIAYIIAGHELHHVKIIKEKYLI